MAPEPSTDEHEVVTDAEVVSDGDGDHQAPGTAVEPLAAAPAATNGSAAVATIWNTHDPEQIVERASKVATALKDVIDRQQMTTSMGGGRQHVNIEGWQTAGTLLGLQAVVTATRRIEPKANFTVKAKRKKWGNVDGSRKIIEETDLEWPVSGYSFEAVAEVRTMDGRLIGRAEATCSREESKWVESDEFAVKSMAQTRACSRALRQALGFIVGMAGYATTPTEEMPAEMADAPPAAAGPIFGRELKEKDKKLFLERLMVLLNHGDAGEAKTAALQVIGKIKAQTGDEDYTPFIAAFAVITAANKLEETDPVKIAEREAAAARKEAEQKQGAAEGADNPAPDESDQAAGTDDLAPPGSVHVEGDEGPGF